MGYWLKSNNCAAISPITQHDRTGHNLNMKPKPHTKRQSDYTKCRTVGIVERTGRGANTFTLCDADTGDDILAAKLKNFLGHEVTVTIELGDKLNPTAKMKR